MDRVKEDEKSVVLEMFQMAVESELNEILGSRRIEVYSDAGMTVCRIEPKSEEHQVQRYVK